MEEHRGKYEDGHMKKILQILRKTEADSKPYWERYVFQTGHEEATVATALASLGEKDLIEPGPVSSGSYRPLVWDHSCLQKKCGACAMVINHRPRLACDTRLADCPGETVVIEPLKKFPVVEDLLVDRTCMMDRLRELSVWLEGEARKGGDDMAFEASKCLQCGLCLEVCPNFHCDGDFGGMAAMAPLSRLIAKLPQKQQKSVTGNYKHGVYEGCGKSLACREICPAAIDIEKLLVRSNAAAVWRRWKSVDKY